jgi:hypothetical protein
MLKELRNLVVSTALVGSMAGCGLRVGVEPVVAIDVPIATAYYETEAVCCNVLIDGVWLAHPNYWNHHHYGYYRHYGYYSHEHRGRHRY